MSKKVTLVLSGLVVFSALAVSNVAVYAAPTPGEGGGGGGGTSDVKVKESCDPNTQDCGQKFINDYISPIVAVLSALVGIFAVISYIIAGIQYASSADEPGVVTQAKQRILATTIGLLAYIFLFAFLNYLVPGGILP